MILHFVSGIDGIQLVNRLFRFLGSGEALLSVNFARIFLKFSQCSMVFQIIARCWRSLKHHRKWSKLEGKWRKPLLNLRSAHFSYRFPEPKNRNLLTSLFCSTLPVWFKKLQKLISDWLYLASYDKFSCLWNIISFIPSILE